MFLVVPPSSGDVIPPVLFNILSSSTIGALVKCGPAEPGVFLLTRFLLALLYLYSLQHHGTWRLAVAATTWAQCRTSEFFLDTHRSTTDHPSITQSLLSGCYLYSLHPPSQEMSFSLMLLSLFLAFLLLRRCSSLYAHSSGDDLPPSVWRGLCTHHNTADQYTYTAYLSTRMSMILVVRLQQR